MWVPLLCLKLTLKTKEMSFKILRIDKNLVDKIEFSLYFQKMDDMLSKYISLIVKYFSQDEEVMLAYLYGSYAKGNADIRSDVDIALLVRQKPRLITKKEIAYALEIENIIKNTEVDVRILNDSPLAFQYQVVKKGRLIFCRNQRLRVRYESNLINEYLDFKPYIEYYDRCMYKNIKEGQLGYRR